MHFSDAENNFLLRSFDIFHSLAFSLSFSVFLWRAEVLWVHFPAQASKTLSRRHSAPSPHLEGAWGLCEQSKPRAGALLAFCVNQGISASFSLLYFLIGRLQTTRFWSIKGPQQTGKPGILQFMGSKRVGHDSVTEQKQQPKKAGF